MRAARENALDAGSCPWRSSVGAVKASEVLAVLAETADAVQAALAGLSDWDLAGTREGQYRSDLVADQVAVAILIGAGFAVLSEESGLHEEGRELLAVLDPVDGSTNAAHGLPWYATSICVLDASGPLVAFVLNHVAGTRHHAVRGEGAWRDGQRVSPSRQNELKNALVALSGFPRRRLAWRQFRAFGAIALDLCAVADGSFDGYLDCAPSSHAPWDYLAGLLICEEAGAVISETAGRDLLVTGHGDRRSPIAAGTKALLDELLASYREAEAGLAG